MKVLMMMMMMMMIYNNNNAHTYQSLKARRDERGKPGG
jgi:hypothetical protein